MRRKDLMALRCIPGPVDRDPAGWPAPNAPPSPGSAARRDPGAGTSIPACRLHGQTGRRGASATRSHTSAVSAAEFGWHRKLLGMDAAVAGEFPAPQMAQQG